METEGNRASCSTCAVSFSYSLIHNGFNESAYAYCDTCGGVALLSGWESDIPEAAGLTLHGPIPTSVEPYLAACKCGGRFRAEAKPRCPTCRSDLSAESMTERIEAQAAGAAAGWRWQRTWDGTYSIEINENCARDPWVHRKKAST